MSICSSNNELIVIAAAPASSMALMLLTRLDSGEADGTIGFFRARPI
jgi:hypothetical protein